MSLLKPASLDEEIIDLLINGSLPAADLLHRLPSKPTKQGFYRALRKLKAEDIVVTYNKQVALNLTWAKQVGEMLDRINAAYGGDSATILSLRDKESVSYSFSDLKQLDNFWGHMQDIVARALPAHAPIYTYDPHYWFYIARPEIEKAHIALANSMGKQFLMTVGGNAPLDKVIQKDFDTDMRQYHMGKVIDKPGYYLVVVGDYVFEARFDNATEHYIESLYATHTTLNDKAREDFEKIPLIEARTRLKISRNNLKARKLKRLLGKNFFVKTK